MRSQLCCWVCSHSGHCTPRWNCSCSPTYTWLCPVHSGASGEGVTPLLPHSVPTCGLHAEQGLHPSCTCVEPSLLQTSSLFQFLKANFSCAESRGKIPIDRKQVGAQPRPEWYKLDNQCPVPKMLSGSAAEGDDFPCLGSAFHSSRVQHLWTPLPTHLETGWFSLVIQFGRLWRF